MKKSSAINWVKAISRYFVDVESIRRRSFRRQYDQINDDQERSGEFAGSDVVAILADRRWNHLQYVSACRELQVSYKVIDPEFPGWYQQVKSLQPRAIFWAPLIDSPARKLFVDDLCGALRTLNVTMSPSIDEMWLYESKRRGAQWLELHDYPRLETWCFWNKEEAMAFAEDAALPLVAKTDQGAVSSGVRVLRNRIALRAYIRKAFGWGHVTRDADPRVRHQGYVLFQAFIPETTEWRFVRCGDSFFCRKKYAQNGFHSGSGKIEWAEPPEDMLNWFAGMTDRHQFRSMNADLLSGLDGKWWVNELHAIWGAQQRLQGQGRWLRSDGQSWIFEGGDWYRNACANLRVADIMMRDKVGRGQQVPWATSRVTNQSSNARMPWP